MLSGAVDLQPITLLVTAPSPAHNLCESRGNFEPQKLGPPLEA